MLTFRQMDSIVHDTLLVFNNIDIARRVEGTNIFYDVYYKNNKEKLGTYRVWEWHDGSGRSDWVPSDNKTQEIEKLRHTIWKAIMAIAVLANQATNEHKLDKTELPKSEKSTIENTRIPAGKYDDLCIRWVNRPYIPKQNKDEFLSEHASELNKKAFDRVLEDAYKRGIIDKVKGRYKLKTVS